MSPLTLGDQRLTCIRCNKVSLPIRRFVEPDVEKFITTSAWLLAVHAGKTGDEPHDPDPVGCRACLRLCESGAVPLGPNNVLSLCVSCYPAFYEMVTGEKLEGPVTGELSGAEVRQMDLPVVGHFLLTCENCGWQERTARFVALPECSICHGGPVTTAISDLDWDAVEQVFEG